MTAFNIKLSSINDVKALVNAATDMSCEIDLISGRYVINAKSLIGIFSIDLTKPITVEVHGSEAEAEQFKAFLGDCIID